MAIYRKPNSPLQHKDGDYFYPLTTVDQVIVDDNTRLSSKLDHILTVDFSDSKDAKASGINADTLGGFPAEDFVKHGDYSFVDKPKAGFIYPLAIATIPEGFLLCDGAEYSREEYPELFIAIGTTYGSGNGSTTFNVPNLQTRVPIGASENYVLGSTGGEETHTLTINEMPRHTHSIESRTVAGAMYGTVTTSNNTESIGAVNTQPTGLNQPHNNMQPYTVVNYIIATGKDAGISVHDIITGVQALPLGIEYGGTSATNAEDARANLGITSENIGAMSMELVWENASPASTFAAQNISVNIPIGAKIEIVCHVLVGYPTKCICQGIVGTDLVLSFADGSNDTLASRACHIGNTEIGFEAGYWKGAVQNAGIIPEKIYLVKGAYI